MSKVKGIKRSVSGLLCGLAALFLVAPVLAQNPQVMPSARFKGGFGLRVDVVNPAGNLIDGNSQNEQRYGARFYINTTELSLQEGDSVEVFTGFNGSDQAQFRIIVVRSSGNNLIQLQARLDGGTFTQLAEGDRTTLPNGWNALEIEWVANAGAGFMNLFLNNNQVTGLTGLANGAGEISAIRTGVVNAPNQTPAGFILLDDFDSRRDTHVGVLCITQAEHDAFKADWPAVNVVRFLEYYTHRCP